MKISKIIFNSCNRLEFFNEDRFLIQQGMFHTDIVKYSEKEFVWGCTIGKHYGCKIDGYLNKKILTVCLVFETQRT